MLNIGKIRFIVFSVILSGYGCLAGAQQRPVIGLSDMYKSGGSSVPRSYIEAVLSVDGIPVIIPLMYEDDKIVELLNSLDGIIFTGGEDFDPSYYDEMPIPNMNRINAPRDMFDIKLLRLAVEHGIPVLGICRGIQLINIAYGGSLYQDLTVQYPDKSIKHRQALPKEEVSHAVIVEDGTVFADMVRERMLMVNSSHHQAIKKVAAGFRVAGTSPDKIIEAIEKVDSAHWIVGVQFHPEVMINNNPSMRRIFKSFVGEASRLKSEKQQPLYANAPESRIFADEHKPVADADVPDKEEDHKENDKAGISTRSVYNSSDDRRTDYPDLKVDTRTSREKRKEEMRKFKEKEKQHHKAQKEQEELDRQAQKEKERQEKEDFEKWMQQKKAEEKEAEQQEKIAAKEQKENAEAARKEAAEKEKQLRKEQEAAEQQKKIAEKERKTAEEQVAKEQKEKAEAAGKEAAAKEKEHQKAQKEKADKEKKEQKAAEQQKKIAEKERKAKEKAAEEQVAKEQKEKAKAARKEAAAKEKEHQKAEKEKADKEKKERKEAKKQEKIAKKEQKAKEKAAKEQAAKEQPEKTEAEAAKKDAE